MLRQDGTPGGDADGPANLCPRRWTTREIWKHERRLLKKLTGELRHTWFFWPNWNASDPGVSEGGELSQQEAAEIDLKVKKMGHSPIF